MRENELVDVEATLVHETDRAYLIDHGAKENVWVPKSVVEHDDGVFTMPRNFAKMKGLI